MLNIRPSVRVDDSHYSGTYLYDTYIVGHREISPETVQHWMTNILVSHACTTVQEFKRVPAIAKVTDK